MLFLFAQILKPYKITWLKNINVKPNKKKKTVNLIFLYENDVGNNS